MGIYSLEIRELMDDPIFELFDFKYDFYVEDLPVIENFEKKFIEHYYYSEIGFETVHRFKRNLRARLNKKMPYWKQLYITELKAQDIDFLLNKDYRETFVKDIEREQAGKGTTTTSSKGTSTNDNTNTSKSSDINNGVASVGLVDGKLTNVNMTNNNGNNTVTDSGTSSVDSTGNETGKESYVLEGKGNIGITSSAELLEKWRNVLINLDEIIIEDCNDLFMQIF